MYRVLQQKFLNKISVYLTLVILTLTLKTYQYKSNNFNKAKFYGRIDEQIC